MPETTYHLKTILSSTFQTSRRQWSMFTIETALAAVNLIFSPQNDFPSLVRFQYSIQIMKNRRKTGKFENLQNHEISVGSFDAAVPLCSIKIISDFCEKLLEAI